MQENLKMIDTLATCPSSIPAFLEEGHVIEQVVLVTITGVLSRAETTRLMSSAFDLCLRVSLMAVRYSA